MNSLKIHKTLSFRNHPSHTTMVLSGPWLIADENVKSQLLKLCKEAKAIEMEGMGIAEACGTHKKHVKCLVEKGVSDIRVKEMVKQL